MKFDLTSIEARIRERERAIRSGSLTPEELEALRGENDQLERELLALRGRLAPQLQQVTALLQQLRATRGARPDRLDVRV